MHILLTGATGFVGQSLVPALLAGGHSLAAWVRSPGRAAEQLGPRVELVATAGGQAAMDAAVARADAVVNLAGEPVIGPRWTAARRQALWDSRVETTRRIVAGIARDPRPRALVSTSAVGFYGDTGDRAVDEDAGPGEGFLADLCQAWEAAAHAAEPHGARVCLVRVGLVLGRGGGVLGSMLPAFRLALGGPLGGGAQWFPWIHLDDLVGLIAAAVREPQYVGPVNAVAPGIVTQKEFARALGAALHRPAVVPVPAFALRLALGEAASALLSGQRVEPRRTQALGFRFAFPALDPALAGLVGR
jgi:uncharacterized protein